VLIFPDDESMRISHEAIYQALYIQGRGALKRELVACLRTGRALRVPRARTRERGKKFVTPELLISKRPAEAEDRAVPGHWEGDLILGLESSAIGTIAERTTRCERCCCICPAWTVTAWGHARRTGPHSPATGLKRSVSRSPGGSPPCPSSCAVH
jgi:IS30 family transposase